MLWQENALVYDCLDKNSILAIFDMQFLPSFASFWQIEALVYDFAPFKISPCQKNRTQAP